MKIKTIFVVLISLAAGTVLAHGGGKSFEKTVGDFTIDVDADVATFAAGKSAVFDLSLANAKTGQPVSFTDIAVKLSHQDHTVFSADLKTENDLASFVYTFPFGGNYVLDVSYQKDNKELATASFPFNVISGGGAETGSAGGSSTAVIAGIIGLLIGAVLVFIFKRG